MFSTPFCLDFAALELRPFKKFYSTRVNRFRKKKIISLEMKRKYRKDHSTIDRVGCGELSGEILFRVERQVFEKPKSLKASKD